MTDLLRPDRPDGAARPVVEDRLNRRGSLEPREPGRPRRSLVVALVLACVTLMTLDHVERRRRGRPAAPAGRRGLRPGRVRRRAAWSTRSSPYPHWLRSQHDLAADIDRLENENDQLRSELATSDYDRNRLQEYDDLTATAESIGYALVPARVIGIGPAQSFSRTVTIDAGARAGLAPGHDRGERRRAGRPGPPGHLDHRHRAAGRRRRLDGGRPGRPQHEGRLPARPRRPRPGRPARPRAGRPDLRARRRARPW